MFDATEIRCDFPILESEVNGKPLVYLDSGATAQKPQCVIRCIEDMYRRYNANIHRGVHRLSEDMTQMYEAARERIREFIGAKQREEARLREQKALEERIMAEEEAAREAAMDSVAL